MMCCDHTCTSLNEFVIGLGPIVDKVEPLFEQSALPSGGFFSPNTLCI